MQSLQYDDRIHTAARMLREGRVADATGLLGALVQATPDLAPAHFLLGVARRLAGDTVGARAALLQALAIAPQYPEAALELARLHNAAGDYLECIATTDAAASLAQPPEALLVERARAFQALDMHEDRLSERQRIAKLYPARPAVHHNLAAAFGDAGHPEDAERAAREALARGGNAPETWLVLARALQSQNLLDEAEHAFGEAVRRRPGYATALRDWAQLAWMRSGDLEQALAVLDIAPGVDGIDELVSVKARLFEAADQAKLGYDLLVAGHASQSAAREMLAARLAASFDARLALSHAGRAAAMEPHWEAARRQLVEALLAAGEAETALENLAPLLQAYPLDQGLIAQRWICWRMRGDERARQLYDYASAVSSQLIETPHGWSSLDDYLADLAGLLNDLHGFSTHPVDQSLRHGTQTSANLLKLDHPLIRALLAAIDRPIRDHLAWIGEGGDPLRSRNSGNYRLAGMWSVRLQPRGYHVGHVHPMGWISSACYVDLPPTITSDTREGWIAFGHPGIPTDPPLDAEFFVQPRNGLLVLFPSFMWHSTKPFDGDRVRLTIAFDICPA